MIAQDRGRRSDLRVALDLHLQKLPANAPLRDVLDLPDIKARLAQFDSVDAAAIKFRRFRLLSLRAAMVATIVGALVLLPVDEWINGWPRWTIQTVQTLALIIAFVATVWVGLRQSELWWVRARTVAEGMRRDLFRAIMRVGVDDKGLLAPALACFRDAHLDWQLGYYNKRGGRHRRDAGITAPYKMVGYLLLAVAVVVGLAGLLSLAARLQLLWPSLDAAMHWVRLEHPERWQLGLGVMASSILGFANARSFMDLDSSNAWTYAMTAAELQSIRSAELANAEKAAASGDVAVVLEFCERVQTILDLEHQGWEAQLRVGG